MLKIQTAPTQIELLKQTLLESAIVDDAPKKTRGNPTFKKKFSGPSKPVRIPEKFVNATLDLLARADREGLSPNDLAALWERNGAQDSGAVGKEGFPLAAVYQVPIGALHCDPRRFQYKLIQTDKLGSTNSLGGVTVWDENLSGTLLVWRDSSDGLVYVVNGHNRLSKALSLGVPSLKCEFIQAENAQEARAVGALKNIAEGNGSIVDAAKFFRDRGYTSQDVSKLKFLPIKQSTVTLGAALADLAPYLFDRIIEGSLDPKDGALIAALPIDAQAETLTALDRGLTGADLGEYVSIISASQSATLEQNTLFGLESFTAYDAVDRAKIMARTVSALGKDRRLFSGAARNASILARGNNSIDAQTSQGIAQTAALVLEKFQAVKLTAGPVADLIGAMAAGAISWERYLSELLDLLA